MPKSSLSPTLDSTAGHDAELGELNRLNAGLDASIDAVRDFAAGLFAEGETVPNPTLDAARDFFLDKVLETMIDNVMKSAEMDERAKEGWKAALATIADAVRSLNPEDIAKKLVLEVIPEAAQVVLDTARSTREDVPRMLDMGKRAELPAASKATPEEVEAIRAILSGDLRASDERRR